MATPTIHTPVAVDPVQLGTSVSTLFTAGANGAVLDYILVVDDTTTAVKVTIHYVPSGGAAGDDNLIAKDVVIPAGGWGVNLLEQIDARPFHMEAGSTIRGSASVASQATVHIGGTDYA
jgi:hypothetical protein